MLFISSGLEGPNCTSFSRWVESVERPGDSKNMPLSVVEKRPHVVKTSASPTPHDFGFELCHLRYFVAVAEHLHFGRAAKALHISQPPVSRQIRDLESCIGTRLFDRTARGVTLTDAGVSFLVESKRILEHVSRSVSAVRRMDHGILQPVSTSVRFLHLSS